MFSVLVQPLVTKTYKKMFNKYFLMRFLVLLFLILFPYFVNIGAQQLSIAAAADLRYALDEIVAVYRKDNPSVQINISYGSSGRFYQQISQGAPFDIFFSADMEYAQKLYEQKLTHGRPVLYAYGYIVLWSSMTDVSGGLQTLLNTSVRKIAIANPGHAPYGKRAIECLSHFGMLERIRPKLVYGENIAHAAQIIQSGNAEAGIIALSLALSPVMINQGSYYMIDEKSYRTLNQAYVIVKRRTPNAEATKFAAFISKPEARLILEHYGFRLPEK